MRGEVLFGGGGGSGRVLYTETALSFWGGVDPKTGVVVDARHPLLGECLAGVVLCIPGGRGSCTSSQVMLELILNGVAPCAIVVREREDILCLGALVAREFFEKDDICIVRASDADFERLRSAETAAVRCGGAIEVAGAAPDAAEGAAVASEDSEEHVVSLTEGDSAMLASGNAAVRAAMRIIVAVAKLQRADELLTVTRAHVDACTYIGDGGLRFAERLVEWGGRVAVETTTNAMSVDREQWRAQKVDDVRGTKAVALGDAYLRLGCRPTFTCAPYLAQDASPSAGDDVAWSESNAVAYANSILGARTQKYADYMDACVAITARAPRAGMHLDAGRVPTVVVDVGGLDFPKAGEEDDAFFATLGYAVGSVSNPKLPIVVGLEDHPRITPEHFKCRISPEHFKSFAAAFATVSASPMFHVAGHTPEALATGYEVAHLARIRVTPRDLWRFWRSLSAAAPGDEEPTAEKDELIQLVAIGSPHCSVAELEALAALIHGKRSTIPIVATMSLQARRATLNAAMATGLAQTLQVCGVELVADTCLCMITEPVVPALVRTMVTNSAKYAHYAPGLVGKPARLASLRGCVAAATTGRIAKVRTHCRKVLA